MQTLLIILIGLVITNLILVILIKTKPGNQYQDLVLKIESIDKSLQKLESNLKDDFRINRQENSNLAKDNRNELSNTLNQFKTELHQTLSDMSSSVSKSINEFKQDFEKNVRSFNELQMDKFKELSENQKVLIQNTEAKLEFIRITVEEKLEKTLSERLGQSFETVGK